MIRKYTYKLWLIILLIISTCVFLACNKDDSLSYFSETIDTEAKGNGGAMNNNSIKQIFTENTKFLLVCDGEEKELSISDIPDIFIPNDPYMKVWNFAIVDLDGDGIEEIMLELYGVSRDMGGYIIFHKENEKVLAYKSTNYRTFWFLKEDGTYTYSSWAGNNDGYAKVLGFDETGYYEDKYTYVIDNHEGGFEYVVDHKGVTEEDFKKAVAIQNNKKDIIWHEFNNENIALYVKQ